jgi:hypothetical protein
MFVPAYKIIGIGNPDIRKSSVKHNKPTVDHFGEENNILIIHIGQNAPILLIGIGGFIVFRGRH